MYPNLEAEFARNKFKNVDGAKVCGITEKSFSNKRTGKTDFTLSEIKKIQATMFPNKTLEYLFSESAS